jgi:hypothetical protein
METQISNGYKYATYKCYICNRRGHIASQCSSVCPRCSAIHPPNLCIDTLSKLIVESNYLKLRHIRRFKEDLHTKSYTEIAKHLNDYYEEAEEKIVNKWEKLIKSKEDKQQRKKFIKDVQNGNIIDVDINEESDSEIIENDEEISIIDRKPPNDNVEVVKGNGIENGVNHLSGSNNNNNKKIVSKKVKQVNPQPSSPPQTMNFQAAINEMTSLIRNITEKQAIQVLRKDFEDMYENFKLQKEILAGTLQQRITEANKFIRERHGEWQEKYELAKQQGTKFLIDFKMLKTMRHEELEKFKAVYFESERQIKNNCMTLIGGPQIAKDKLKIEYYTTQIPVWKHIIEEFSSLFNIKGIQYQIKWEELKEKYSNQLNKEINMHSPEQVVARFKEKIGFGQQEIQHINMRLLHH